MKDYLERDERLGHVRIPPNPWSSLLVVAVSTQRHRSLPPWVVSCIGYVCTWDNPSKKIPESWLAGFVESRQKHSPRQLFVKSKKKLIVRQARVYLVWGDSKQTDIKRASHNKHLRYRKDEFWRRVGGTRSMDGDRKRNGTLYP